jgi:hypothetical protein
VIITALDETFHQRFQGVTWIRKNHFGFEAPPLAFSKRADRIIQVALFDMPSGTAENVRRTSWLRLMFH